MTIIEAVPNVSEGCRRHVLDELVGAVRRIAGVSLLDMSADPSHNRCVLTIAGEANPLLAALLSLYDVATKRIDLRTHRGVHPRIGAVDVVPFVPLQNASMNDCIELAHRLGRAVADRFAVPVFLYEEATTRPEHRALEAVRRGQFEGLAEKMKGDVWRPDFGPATPHPSAGASAIGARGLLIAFNVNLDTDDLDAARQIARDIRERDGGLDCVKAIGLRLEHKGLVQVSVNLIDYTRTALHQVFAEIEREATTRGVSIAGSELIGLVPLGAVVATAAHALHLGAFKQSQVLEEQFCSEKSLPPLPSAAER